ncbi:alpha/beta fold hydrolase [Aquimarina litoralis]|uniref:alpha/beta fold hydrolase n=1 Tax=Aquimarina litoralis TaxID=584605 RepID=UPI001C56E4DD|nr:alpha/beta hydrolase [Aquimarina litoralis]MBW1297459.1 alpha/beta fold hydrolase [Aquimarina litoralis]
MNLQDWKNSGSYFTFKNYQIFYKKEGKGDSLVLVHGFPTSSWDWHKIWTSLTERYEVYAIDMLGFGFSSKPNDFVYTIGAQVDVWEAFLLAQEISSIHILAHDYGDTVVQEMLARTKENNTYPLNINSVCFLNGGMFPETNFPTFTQKMLLTPLGELLKHFMGRHTLAKNFKKIFGKETQASEQEIDEFWETIAYNSGKNVIPKLIKYLKERKVHKIRWREAIQYTDIPKRLIDGGVDPISGKHMAEFYKENIPKADVIILETIGHYPQTEAPDEVLHYYNEFIVSLF